MKKTHEPSDLLDPITPMQLRMARAALSMSMAEFGKQFGLSKMALSRYENDDLRVISVDTAKRITGWFNSHRVYFGPKEGVCVGGDAFCQEQFMSIASFQLLADHGIKPDSTDLIAAYRRAIGSNAPAKTGE